MALTVWVVVDDSRFGQDVSVHGSEALAYESCVQTILENLAGSEEDADAEVLSLIDNGQHGDAVALYNENSAESGGYIESLSVYEREVEVDTASTEGG